MKFIIIILFTLLNNSIVYSQRYIRFSGYNQLTSNKIHLKNVFYKPRLLAKKYLLKDTPYCDRVYDSAVFVNYWRLDKSKKIIHIEPNFSYKLLFDISDTISIYNQKFPIQPIIHKEIAVSVKDIFEFRDNENKYIIIKIIDISSSRSYNCFLLVFNTTDTQKIMCLNTISDINGNCMLQRENLITDINKDGHIEINTYDSFGIKSYEIRPDKLECKQYLRIIRNIDNKLVIDRKKSNWYFNLQESNNCKIIYDTINYRGIYNLNL